MDLNLAFLLVQFESQKGNYLLMPQEVVLCDHSVRQPTPHISADHQPTSQLPIYFLSSVHLMILRGDLLTHLTFWLLTLVVAMSMQMYLYTSVPMKGKKNPAYGRHRISRPMRIVGPIQFWRGCVISLKKK